MAGPLTEQDALFDRSPDVHPLAVSHDSRAAIRHRELGSDLVHAPSRHGEYRSGGLPCVAQRA